jgi:hypothetical protein
MCLLFSSILPQSLQGCEREQLTGRFNSLVDISRGLHSAAPTFGNVLKNMICIFLFDRRSHGLARLNMPPQPEQPGPALRAMITPAPDLELLKRQTNNAYFVAYMLSGSECRRMQILQMVFDN